VTNTILYIKNIWKENPSQKVTACLLSIFTECQCIDKKTHLDQFCMPGVIGRELSRAWTPLKSYDWKSPEKHGSS
jgi:hypothetical protein